MGLNRKSLVILTGAGVSQESGIATFRDANGLWENHSVEEVASPQGFARNPELVQKFYNLRRAQLKTVQPGAAHAALAELEGAWDGDFLLVTQNVDDLHQRAGSRRFLAMHGELKKVRCTSCESPRDWDGDLAAGTVCDSCQRGLLRPHIVWFGEVPLRLDEAFEALERCDLFVSIGTSGTVYPAAGFVDLVPPAARTVECNAEATAYSDKFSEHRRGKAGQTVPLLVRELLEGQRK